MPVPNDQPSLLTQIDTELQLIQAKLTDTAQTGSNLAAIIATAVTNEATTNAVIDTLTTNVDVTAALLVTLLDSGNAGTGLGPVASMQQADLTSFFVDAITAET